MGILLFNGIDEPVEGCFLARYLRYAKKIILGISNICLWLFFSNVLISNQNPSKSTDSLMGRKPRIHYARAVKDLISFGSCPHLRFVDLSRKLGWDLSGLSQVAGRLEKRLRDDSHLSNTPQVSDRQRGVLCLVPLLRVISTLVVNASSYFQIACWIYCFFDRFAGIMH